MTLVKSWYFIIFEPKIMLSFIIIQNKKKKTLERVDNFDNFFDKHSRSLTLKVSH